MIESPIVTISVARKSWDIDDGYKLVITPDRTSLFTLKRIQWIRCKKGKTVDGDWEITVAGTKVGEAATMVEVDPALSVGVKAEVVSGFLPNDKPKQISGEILLSNVVVAGPERNEYNPTDDALPTNCGGRVFVVNEADTLVFAEGPHDGETVRKEIENDTWKEMELDEGGELLISLLRPRSPIPVGEADCEG